MGASQRNKGARNERSIVNELREHALDAKRVPLSGALGGELAGDIWVPVQGARRVFEAKKRAAGFKQIYDWLGTHFGLFIGADRRETLVVLRLSDFAKLISDATPA